MPSPIIRLRLTGLRSLALVLPGLFVCPSGWSQSSVARLAEQEAARRQQRVISAADDIARADTLMRQGKTADSHTLFEDVYTSLPSAPLTEEMKKVALSGYVQTGCARARELMRDGRRTDADELLKKLLTASPNDRRVRETQAELDDPDRYPPALTAEHVKRVGEVERLLLVARSAFEIGDYNKAISTYQDVLRLDPYNSAARRGMEEVERGRSQYFGAARDQNRARMLTEVAKSWEDPVPPSATDVSAMFGALEQASANSKSGRIVIQDKLKRLVMPKVEFQGATIVEVIELLRVRSRDLDSGGKGVDFVVNVPEEAGKKPISLSMENVPIAEVLRYVTELAGVTYKVGDFAVEISSTAERNSAIITRSFRVPPDFIENSPAAPPAGAVNDPFALPAAAPGAPGLTVRRMGAKDFLANRGVPFPDGTFASFNAAASTLTVRNTVANMEMVETLVDLASKNSPKQAIVTVRMIEVTQQNLDELGFDWLLGGASANGSVFTGGGNAGSGIPFNPANYAFGNATALPAFVVGGIERVPARPVTSAIGGPLPFGVPVTAGGGAGGSGPITSGLRSGTFATDTSSLDTLLTTGSTTKAQVVAPGIFSIAGVFSDPQFQTVIRALGQKKGVDVNASPSVTTKSGVKATVEITREFIYPTEFDPPQLPQAGGGNINLGGGGNQIATPTTPTAFEMRKTGVLVDVEPVISDDARTVELTITPELTDFEGFINYGSPIFSPASFNFLPVRAGGLGGSLMYLPLSQPEQLITPNLILQPVFKTNKVATSVKVWDGQTIVLGGVKRQEHTIVDDSLPILGNMPFIGRLFRSHVKQTETKNIVIFVTVDIIDPSGQKINRQTAAVSP